MSFEDQIKNYGDRIRGKTFERLESAEKKIRSALEQLEELRDAVEEGECVYTTLQRGAPVAAESLNAAALLLTSVVVEHNTVEAFVQAARNHEGTGEHPPAWEVNEPAKRDRVDFNTNMRSSTTVHTDLGVPDDAARFKVGERVLVTDALDCDGYQGAPVAGLCGVVREGPYIGADGQPYYDVEIDAPRDEIAKRCELDVLDVEDKMFALEPQQLASPPEESEFICAQCKTTKGDIGARGGSEDLCVGCHEKQQAAKLAPGMLVQVNETPQEPGPHAQAHMVGLTGEILKGPYTTKAGMFVDVVLDGRAVDIADACPLSVDEIREHGKRFEFAPRQLDRIDD